MKTGTFTMKYSFQGCIALRKQVIHNYKLISGVCIVKWNDNSAVQLTSNFVAIHPIQNVLRSNTSSQ